MTTVSPITDIHKAEKAAKKKIEQAKEDNAKKTFKTRESEDDKLQKMEEGLRAAGKDQYILAKDAATKAADDKMRDGKAKNEALIERAKSKMDAAVKEGLEAFQAHIGA